MNGPEQSPASLRAQLLGWRRRSTAIQIAALVTGGPIPSARPRRAEPSFRAQCLGTTGQWATLVAQASRIGGLA